MYTVERYNRTTTHSAFSRVCAYSPPITVNATYLFILPILHLVMGCASNGGCLVKLKIQKQWKRKLLDFGSCTPMRRESSWEGGEHPSPKKSDGHVTSFPGLLPRRITHTVEGKRSRLVPCDSQVLYRENAMGDNGILRPSGHCATDAAGGLHRIHPSHVINRVQALDGTWYRSTAYNKYEWTRRQNQYISGFH